MTPWAIAPGVVETTTGILPWGVDGAEPVPKGITMAAVASAPFWARAAVWGMVTTYPTLGASAWAGEITRVSGSGHSAW